MAKRGLGLKSAKPKDVFAALEVDVLARRSLDSALVVSRCFPDARDALLAKLARKPRTAKARAIISLFEGGDGVDPMTGEGEPFPFVPDDGEDEGTRAVLDAFFAQLIPHLGTVSAEDAEFWLACSPSDEWVRAARASPQLDGLAALARETGAEVAQREAERRAAALHRPAKLLGLRPDLPPFEVLEVLLAEGRTVPPALAAQFGYELAYALLEDVSWLPPARAWLDAPLALAALPSAVRVLTERLAVVVPDRGAAVFEALLAAPATAHARPTLLTAAILNRAWQPAVEKALELLPEQVLVRAVAFAPDAWADAARALATRAPRFAALVLQSGALVAVQGEPPPVAAARETLRSTLEARAAAAANDAALSPVELVELRRFDEPMTAALVALRSAPATERAARAIDALFDDPRAEALFPVLATTLMSVGDATSLQRIEAYVARANVSVPAARYAIKRLAERVGTGG